MNIRSLTWILWVLISSTASALALNTRQELMIENLNRVRDIYYQHYAPLVWKNEQKPNLIQNKYSVAYQAILQEPAMTKDRFRQLLYDFVHATRDYHVNITFFSSETSLLPITVRSADKKVFVAYVDPKATKDDPTYAGIAVGDQITQWNGKDPATVLNDLVERMEINSPGTDLRLAEFFMTSRFKSARLPVEQGTLVVRFLKPSKDPNKKPTEYSRALIWKHTREEIPQEVPVFENLLTPASWLPENPSTQNMDGLDGDLMAYLDLRNSLLNENPKEEDPKNPYDMGSRNSYVPKLGDIIWENDSKSPFHAYVYKNGSQLIGYLRIPNYGFKDKTTITALNDAITALQEKSDALVLDQVNNPGGLVPYAYGIVSRLIKEPAFVLPRQVVVNEEDASDAFKLLQSLKKEESEPTKPDELEPYGLAQGKSFNLGLGDFAHFLLDQIGQGKHLTEVYPYLGISQINPHPKVHYDKPILMLIDEMDISCGDLVPAILKDGGGNRVTLFGGKTSGADGFVKSLQFPNQFGIARMSLTYTKSIRKNGEPLENVGVSPDIAYAITPDDLQNNYGGYKAAVNKAVLSLITQ